MKLTKGLFSFLTSDRFLVFACSVFDLILIFYAKSYVNSVNHLSTRAIASQPSEVRETQSIQVLQQKAKTGSWDQFEKIRLEEVSYYLQSNSKVSSGNALYFFPETLPPQSLEKDFAKQELLPGIDALKKACKAQKKIDASLAFKRLKSRVENYELGTSADRSQLSEEAQKFLNLYQELSQLSQ